MEPVTSEVRRRRNTEDEKEKEEELGLEAKTVKERSADWNKHFQGVGGVFQKLGPSTFQV